MSGLLNLVEAATALTQLVSPTNFSQPTRQTLSSTSMPPVSTETVSAAPLNSSYYVRRASTHTISDDDDTMASTKIATLRENHLQALRAAATRAGLAAATPPAPPAATAYMNQKPLMVATPAPTTQAYFPQQVRIARGDSKEMFPMRLHALLSDPTVRDVISWLPHGKSFVVLRPDVFANQVLPRYFAPEGSNSLNAKTTTMLGKDGSLQTKNKGVHKYPSFTRKLNRWGFRQISRGPDAGAFCHELFQRDDPNLCRGMVCQKSRKLKKGLMTGGMSDDMMSVSSASTMGTKSVASVEKRPFSSTVTVSTAGATSNRSLPFKKRKSGEHTKTDFMMNGIPSMISHRNQKMAASTMMNGIPSMISHRNQKMAASTSSVTESDLTSDNGSVCSANVTAPPKPVVAPAAAVNNAALTAEAVAREALARHFHEQHRAFALASLMENSRLAMAAAGLNNQASGSSSVASVAQKRANESNKKYCVPVVGAITTHSPAVFAPTVSIPEKNKVSAVNAQASSAESAKSALYEAYLQALSSSAASS
ncbi:hypothetical protein ACHAXR_006428 [Thalassiosira sp. AJA248-18]